MTMDRESRPIEGDCIREGGRKRGEASSSSLSLLHLPLLSVALFSRHSPVGPEWDPSLTCRDSCSRRIKTYSGARIG